MKKIGPIVARKRVIELIGAANEAVACFYLTYKLEPLQRYMKRLHEAAKKADFVFDVQEERKK